LSRRRKEKNLDRTDLNIFREEEKNVENIYERDFDNLVIKRNACGMED
jgi:hypothetical protein